jgi:hypothetical protein
MTGHNGLAEANVTKMVLVLVLVLLLVLVLVPILSLPHDIRICVREKRGTG